jgi:hypothetical protein
MKRVLILVVLVLASVLTIAQPGPRIAGKPIVFTSGDTTPSVRRGTYFKTHNLVTTTIFRFDSVSTGDEFMVEVGDNYTTVKDTTLIDWPENISQTFINGDIFQCKEQSGVCSCWVVRLK